ncbi:MAG TPA: helix-turn-helix transcriptional regulator [Rhizomicrobium sp.]|jgi:DNA-binding XRE family transcriptional regulator
MGWEAYFVQSQKSVRPSKQVTASTDKNIPSNGLAQAMAKFDSAHSQTVAPKKRAKSVRGHRSILKQFGRNLRELRLLRGLTQEELATKSQIPLSSISICELGKQNINLRQLYRLCAALDTNLKRIWRGI